MNKLVHMLPLFVLVLLISGFAQAQVIILDGDSTDWADTPNAIEWVNNQDGWYPSEVGAAIKDVVNVRAVKAKMAGRALYVFMRFWGTPAWPANNDEKVVDGVTLNRSRGYYHLLLDMDNDPTTGWNTDYYETHYTPVGYLRSQGESYSNIGSEGYVYWGCSYNWPNDGGGVSSMGYGEQDHSEKDYQADTGVTYDLWDEDIANPDSAKAMAWQGTLECTGTDGMVPSFVGQSFWAGHAWGQAGGDPAAVDFAEFGYDVTAHVEHFAAKGKEVFKEGDVIGIAAFIETPSDDWGVDMTDRGEFTVPETVPMRPSMITFDGDSSDWDAVPEGVHWVNNQDGWYPSEVGAAIKDVVNVRSLKLVVNNTENAAYFFMRMWGTPAWPANNDEKVVDGVTLNRSRGYYHVLLDLDNDPTTGWDTDYYETHYTPVGYLRSQGESYENIGSETYIYWGCSYNWPNDGGGVSSMGYGTQDHSEKDYQADTGVTYDLWDEHIVDPDSAKAMHYDGFLMATAGNSEAADKVVDGQPIWVAHAWGSDFMEAGFEISKTKKYWMLKDGTEVFKTGDVIGFAGFVETPSDDWGVDMTTRGQTTVVTSIDDGLQNGVVAKEFTLANNYPNPFNPSTTINFTVPKASDVTLTIYNTLGQRIATLVNENMAQGNHSVVWNGRNDAGQTAPTGLYFYTLRSDQTSITKKMLLVK